MQNWFFEPLDIYCERVGSGFWDEPLNAITNISFFIAAWFAWRLAQDKSLDTAKEVKVLAVLIAVIGVGSLLFHTLALRWTLYADIIPITLYQGVFLCFYLRKISKLSYLLISFILLLFLFAHFTLGMLPIHALNGSITYSPALIFLLGIGYYHLHTKKQFAWGLLIASMLFAISLAFRTIDLNVCENLSIGTHSLWHLLNGFVLYLTVSAYVLNRPYKTNT
jgi:hypothetical protein